MSRALTLLLTLLLTVTVGPVAYARAPEPPTAESVEVSLDTMLPLNPQPGKALRMGGRLRNRGSLPVTALQVRLLLSSTPMATRSEIGSIVDGAADRDGPPTLAVSEPITDLQPRNSVAWSLELPLDELPLSSPGVYVAGLEVIGTGADGLTQRFGLTRTFLPWFPEGSVQPARVSWLWPVTANPDRALDGVQLNEQTAAEIAPGGRLSRIITAAGDARITWVFDPALLQTAEDMVDGYTVLSPVGISSAGAGMTVAQGWLAEVRQVAADNPSIATAYALPDAMALERANMSDSIAVSAQRAAADVSAATRTPVAAVLAWPPGGLLTPSALRAFATGGATSVLLSDAAFPPSPPLTYTPDGFTTWAGLPVALSDSGLGAALRMPQNTRSEALLARQRFLSELAMTSGELPDDARSLVAAPDPLWAPRTSFLKQTLRALEQVPYANLAPLAAARRRAVEVARTRVAYGPAQRTAELSRPFLAQVQSQKRAARRFAAVLTEPTGLGYDEALLRQTSGSWRLDQNAGQALISTVTGQIQAQTAQVRVATTGTFTLPGDTGRIPVTVANDLAQDVTVGIRLESDEPARLSSDEVEPLAVPAGRKVSLEVEAKIVGSGALPVRIQLVTPAGRRYGDPVTVSVRTTAYSRAAAYVVSGAFVILAFLLGMNFVRRTHARRKDRPA